MESNALKSNQNELRHYDKHTEALLHRITATCIDAVGICVCVR